MRAFITVFGAPMVVLLALSFIMRDDVSSLTEGIVYVGGYWGTAFACVMYFQWRDMLEKQSKINREG